MDTYLITSIGMVFLALLEYSVILFAMHVSLTLGSCSFFLLPLDMVVQFQYSDSTDVKRKKRSLKRRMREKDTEAAGTADGDGESSRKDADVLQLVDSVNTSLLASHPQKALLKQDAYKVYRVSVRKVDMVALALLPLAFGTFNLYYWLWMADE